MKTFIINRKNWHRGQNSKYQSRLLVPQTGRMCCLGQIARQLGYAKEEIRDVCGPEDLNDISKFEKCGFVYDTGTVTGLTVNMIEINDSGEILNKEREAQLIKVAAKKNIKLEFIN